MDINEDIKNCKYIKYLNSENNSGIQATINNVVSTVPLDLANRHYAEIKRRVDAGELTIEDAD
tara:strand:+ start:117 stop:305 length:189 start_codon:yes stop_codon:yes gene_type:complete